MTARKLAAGVLSTVVLEAAAPAVAQGANFEGTVTAKNPDARTFTIRQDEGGGTFKIKVTKSTKFQRLSGYSAIDVGGTNIEATARRDGGRWVALTVERSRKAGGGGGGGNDDGPNHQ